MGLHVVGEGLNAEQRCSMLDAAGVTERRSGGGWMDYWLWITKFRRSCMLWMAATSVPRPAAICLRTTDVLPTGRNLHGFDPFRIPSAFAVRDGALQAERLMARYQADNGTSARDGGDGAVGHRQSEDRGRADRAGALASRRRTAHRQLRPGLPARTGPAR